VATPAAERVTVGLVRGLHGLRGAVRVEVLSDEPGRFAVGSVLYLEDDGRPLTVAWTAPAKPGLLVRFEEFPSRESVEPLRDRYLEAVPDEPLPEGTYYWHQLRGLAVSTVDGRDLGTVVDVFRAGGGEVYVVRGGALGEILVPGVRGVVVELDPGAGRLVVDPVALDLPDRPPRRRRRHEVSPRERKAARARSGKAARPSPPDDHTQGEAGPAREAGSDPEAGEGAAPSQGGS
jgi:16S rRNA processing protein RimM